MTDNEYHETASVNFDHRFTKISRIVLNRKGLLCITKRCLLLGLRAHRAQLNLAYDFRLPLIFWQLKMIYFWVHNSWTRQYYYMYCIYTHLKTMLLTTGPHFFGGEGAVPIFPTMNNLNLSNHSHEAPEIPPVF